jgi:glyoxylate utilization-related uncharacterized protein
MRRQVLVHGGPAVTIAPEHDGFPPGGLPRGQGGQQLVADVRVLAGQLQLTVAGEQITLEQGDAYIFPASIQHTFGVPRAAGQARVLWVFHPLSPTPASTSSQTVLWAESLRAGVVST